MLWEQISDNSIFTLIPEIEALYATLSILSGNESLEYCKEIYSENTIALWKKKYRFLFDSAQAVSALKLVSFLDIYSDMDLKNIKLGELQELALTTPTHIFIQNFFVWDGIPDISEISIEKALSDDSSFLSFYEKIESQCPNYLGVYAFFHETSLFIKEYFSLTKELMNSLFTDELNRYKVQIDFLMKEAKEKCLAEDPMTYSQNLMGKTFFNQGPYERFYFLPSIFLPFRCIRYFVPDNMFHTSKLKQQIFVINIRKLEDKITRDETTLLLKAIADNTRYQILEILSKQGPVHGREICKILKIAPSTLSHHMELLNECGLITKEQVKTSKYYGVNKHRINEFLEVIREEIGTK